MQGFSIDNNLIHFLLVVMVVLLIVQAYVLLRIRNILQAISMNFDSVIYFWRKFISSQEKSNKAPRTQPKVTKTCQFCKHRLAYINTSKTRDDEENFYHRCSLRNIDVSLRDSCTHFEQDTSSVEED